MSFAKSGEHGTPEETSDYLYENFFRVNILSCVVKGSRTDDDYMQSSKPFLHLASSRIPRSRPHSSFPRFWNVSPFDATHHPRARPLRCPLLPGSRKTSVLHRLHSRSYQRQKKKILVAGKHTTKSVVVTNGAAPVLRASGSLQAGPSLQGGSVQAATSWQALSRNARSSFQTAVGSPSHVMTTHDTHHDSDSD